MRINAEDAESAEYAEEEKKNPRPQRRRVRHPSRSTGRPKVLIDSGNANREIGVPGDGARLPPAAGKQKAAATKTSGTGELVRTE